MGTTENIVGVFHDYSSEVGKHYFSPTIINTTRKANTMTLVEIHIITAVAGAIVLHTG